VDLDGIADELYGLAPDEFVTARKERERQARESGDKGLAAEIHALSKPNLVAWLLNQLARDHPDEVRALLELGSDLRRAMADRSGDRIRQLTHRQREVVGSLMREAERRAGAAGRSISDATARVLEDSLRAAMADPEAGRALASGRLTAGMEASGFGGPASVPGTPAAPADGPSAPRRTSRSRSKQRSDEPGRDARRRDALARAEAAVAETAHGRQQAERRLEQLEAAVADATEEVERVRRQLHEAMEAQSAAKKEQRDARSALDRRDRAAEDALRRLDELTGSGPAGGRPAGRRTT